MNILPACDTVRRTGISGYPLLKLQAWESDKFHPDLCLLDGTEPVYLAIPFDKQWDCVSVVNFSAGELEQCVVANREDGRFVFEDNFGTQYQWVADLKSSTMLSIQQILFPKMIRIGVDEFDWLRNNRGKAAIAWVPNIAWASSDLKGYDRHTSVHVLFRDWLVIFWIQPTFLPIY